MPSVITEFLSGSAPPPDLPASPIDLVPWTPEDDPCQSFIHSGWFQIRRRIDASLGRIQAPDARRRRFRDCGSSATIYRNTATGELKVKASWCHDRFCQVCAGQRARHIAAVVSQQLAHRRPLMITLTLADTSPGLTDALNRLYAGFRQLRATAIWRQHISGGVAFLEVKYSDRGHRWHPHLHIIAEGSYIPQSVLSATWHGITGDSFIVHITREADHEGARSYCTKYASKPLNGSFSGNDQLLDDAIRSLRGRRLCATFGSWRGVKLSDETPLPDENDDGTAIWTIVAPLSDVLAKARSGDADARLILSALLSRRLGRPVDCEGERLGRPP